MSRNTARGQGDKCAMEPSPSTCLTPCNPVSPRQTCCPSRIARPLTQVAPASLVCCAKSGRGSPPSCCSYYASNGGSSAAATPCAQNHKRSVGAGVERMQGGDACVALGCGKGRLLHGRQPVGPGYRAYASWRKHATRQP